MSDFDKDKMIEEDPGLYDPKDYEEYIKDFDPNAKPDTGFDGLSKEAKSLLEKFSRSIDEFFSELDKVSELIDKAEQGADKVSDMIDKAEQGGGE